MNRFHPLSLMSLLALFACNEGSFQPLPNPPSPIADADADSDAESDADTDTDTDSDTDTDTDSDSDADTDTDTDTDTDADSDTDTDADADTDTDTDADADTDTDTDTDADTDPVPVPEIDVRPLAIEYGFHPLGVVVTESVAVFNLGTADLTVSNVQLSGNAAFTYTDQTSFVVSPGGQVELDVVYTSNELDNDGTLLIQSNDADESAVLVALQSTSARPDLVIEPPAVDFGTLDPTCFDVETLVLRNAGSVDLSVTDIVLDETTGTVSLENLPTLPLTLAAGATSSLDVRYSSDVTVNVLGAVDVTSTDPDGIESATLLGRTAQRTGTATAVQPPDLPIDVIFFVDQSGSMDDFSGDMAAQLSFFTNALSTVSADWRVAVTTYDNGTFNEYFVNDTQYWFDSTSFNLNDFEDAVTAGDQNNSNNQLTEKLFHIAGRAVSIMGPGALNSGFRRSNGVLHLIFISDEEEQSTVPPNGSAEPNYNDIPTALSVYRSYVANPSLLRVSAIANLNSNCGTYNPPNFINRGARYAAMVDLAAAGQAFDICDEDWGNQLASLGANTRPNTVVQLSGEPDLTSLVVTAGGTPIAPADYVVDPLALTVTLNQPAATGVVVQATWNELPQCTP